MRADMFKVIVERPRHGVRGAPAIKLRKDRCPDRSFVGHKRHVHEQTFWSKSFNENLAPLRRYLWKQRGRRWDDVFSEICAHLDLDSTVKRHVRQHLDDFVLTHLSRGRHGEWLHEGWVVAADPPRRRQRELYVDPADGVLKDAAALYRPRAPRRGEPDDGAA